MKVWWKEELQSGWLDQQMFLKGALQDSSFPLIYEEALLKGVNTGYLLPVSVLKRWIHYLLFHICDAILFAWLVVCVEIHIWFLQMQKSFWEPVLCFPRRSGFGVYLQSWGQEPLDPTTVTLRWSARSSLLLLFPLAPELHRAMNSLPPTHTRTQICTVHTLQTSYIPDTDI